MPKKVSYKNAKKELEDIIETLESGDLDIDVLSNKVKRATELIHICKTKLLKTELDVKTILEDFEKTKETKGKKEEKSIPQLNEPNLFD